MLALVEGVGEAVVTVRKGRIEWADQAKGPFEVVLDLDDLTLLHMVSSLVEDWAAVVVAVLVHERPLADHKDWVVGVG